MSHTRGTAFDDMQALLRFGNGKLTESAFLLLEIKNTDAARQWLNSAPISNAVATDPPPDTSLQIAFSAPGLAAIGLERAEALETSVWDIEHIDDVRTLYPSHKAAAE